MSNQWTELIFIQLDQIVTINFLMIFWLAWHHDPARLSKIKTLQLIHQCLQHFKLMMKAC